MLRNLLLLVLILSSILITHFPSWANAKVNIHRQVYKTLTQKPILIGQVNKKGSRFIFVRLWKIEQGKSKLIVRNHFLRKGKIVVWRSNKKLSEGVYLSRICQIYRRRFNCSKFNSFKIGKQKHNDNSEKDNNPFSPPPLNKCTIKEPDKKSSSVTLTIGIDGHYAGWTDQEIEHRKQLSVRLTRHEWDLDNPVTSEQHQVLAAAQQIDTRIHALIGGNSLPDGSKYKSYVMNFLSYWGQDGQFWQEHPNLNENKYSIKTIELGNEPYFGAMSIQEYAAAIKPALQAINSSEKKVKVLLPSYINGQNTFWPQSLYQLIPNLNQLFDGFAIHPYWYGHSPDDLGDGSPLQRIITLRKLMNKQGSNNKNIYITEYGQSTAKCGLQCVSEQQQADDLATMIQAINKNKQWRVKELFIYQLQDRATNSAEREKQFGILRENGNTKPAYQTIKNFIK